MSTVREAKSSSGRIARFASRSANGGTVAGQTHPYQRFRHFSSPDTLFALLRCLFWVSARVSAIFFSLLMFIVWHVKRGWWVENKNCCGDFRNSNYRKIHARKCLAAHSQQIPKFQFTHFVLRWQRRFIFRLSSPGAHLARVSFFPFLAHFCVFYGLLVVAADAGRCRLHTHFRTCEYCVRNEWS